MHKATKATKSPMNKYSGFSITISDHAGSKYYSIRPSTKKYLKVIVLTVITFLLGSIATHIFQYKKVNVLSIVNQQQTQELDRFVTLSSQLGQDIASHESQYEKITNWLSDIEGNYGISDGNLISVSLYDRIDRIGQFYNSREKKYSSIGDRVNVLEEVVGLGTDAVETKTDNIIERVDLASMTVRQQKILHDSIPSGQPMHNNSRISSAFGMRVHPITRLNTFHTGSDLPAQSGEKVHATADGIIRKAEQVAYYGNLVEITHNFGFETRYAHLDKIIVKVGDVVQKGDILGLSGNTGRSIGPHLHYEIRYLDKPINPYQFLNWEFGSHEIFTKVGGIKWQSLISLINKQITPQTLQLSQLGPFLPEQ